VSLTPLGPGSEFDLIRRVLAGGAPADPQVALSAGDDCALIQAGEGYLALTTDLSVEGAHFLPDWGTPELVGRRAVLAALSDLAAMAAEPFAVLVSLNVPAGAGPELVEQVGLACRNAAEEHGAALIGGDLSRGGAQLALDVAAVGRVERPLLRSGVRPGDELWVTGALGSAAAAVIAWKAGGTVRDEWRQRFWALEPRVREARWLAERGASAGIDLSDGLIADAGHLAAASGVGIELDWAATPASESVDIQLALSGGEDYELLVALPGGILGPEAISEFRHAFGLPLTRVGRAVVGSGVRVFRDGEPVELAAVGFDHFDHE